MKRVDRRVVWGLSLVLCLCGAVFAEDPPEEQPESTPAEAQPETPAKEPTLSWTQHEEQGRAVAAGAGEGSIILRAVRGGTQAPGEEVRVYTNADLEQLDANLSPQQRLQGVYQAERHIGKPAPSGTMDETAEGSPASAPSVEPETARQRVQDFRGRIAELERELLALRNPLLSRRSAGQEPDTPNDSAEGEDPVSNVERVERVEEELRSTREALRQAEADLARISPDDVDAP